MQMNRRACAMRLGRISKELDTMLTRIDEHVKNDGASNRGQWQLAALNIAAAGLQTMYAIDTLEKK